MKTKIFNHIKAVAFDADDDSAHTDSTEVGASNGKVFTFNVRACAETFQQAYGGTLITDQMYSSIYAELLVDNNSEV